MITTGSVCADLLVKIVDKCGHVSHVVGRFTLIPQVCVVAKGGRRRKQEGRQIDIGGVGGRPAELSLELKRTDTDPRRPLQLQASKSSLSSFQAAREGRKGNRSRAPDEFEPKDGLAEEQRRRTH